MQLYMFLLVVTLLPHTYGRDTMTLICGSKELRKLELSIHIRRDASLFSECDEIISVNLTQINVAYLEKQAFKKLTYLKHLDLSYNKITSLPTGIFSDTEKLEDLCVVKNLITSLKKNLFANLPYLKFVDFRYNNINYIEEECFVNVPSLTTIDLSHNNLQTLQFNIIDDASSLQTMHLVENPWNCDPDLCEFMHTVVTRFWQESLLPKCRSPDATRGKTFKEVIETPLPAIVSNGNLNMIGNEPVVLKCHICSNSSVTWISQKEINFYNKNENRQTFYEKYYTLATLTINNFSILDTGNYTCYAGNCSTCKSNSTVNLDIDIRTFLNFPIAIQPTFDEVTLPTYEWSNIGMPTLKTQDYSSYSHSGTKVGVSVGSCILIIIAVCCRFWNCFALMGRVAEPETYVRVGHFEEA